MTCGTPTAFRPIYTDPNSNGGVNSLWDIAYANKYFDDNGIGDFVTTTKTLENSIWVIDDYTNELASFTRVYDVVNANIDGVIIRKKESKFYKRNFTGLADVRWWGAKGNGSTNDTAAIQRANDACTVLKIGLWFNGLFHITSGVTQTCPKWEFATFQYGNGGTCGIYVTNPNYNSNDPSTRFNAVSFNTNASGSNLNMTLHGGGDLNNPAQAHGFDFVGGFGLCEIRNLRVFNFYGRGARFNKIYDSVVENTSIERCGIQPSVNGSYQGEWAFSVLESGDTSNHTIFNRVQVELARGKAMNVEANNLCLTFNNIHSERTEICADGGYTHILLGGSSTYFTARIEAVPGAPKILIGGAGTSYDAWKCPDGQVDVHNGQDGFTMNIKNLDAANVTCTNGGNPNICFIGLRCSGLFRVDYQRFVSVINRSLLHDVHIEGEAAFLTLNDCTISGTFSSGGNNTLKTTDCTINGSFPTNSSVTLSKGTVANSFSPATNSIVRSYETTFLADIALNTNESRFYGFGIIVNGNLTWNGGGRGYGLLDSNCRIAGAIDSKWYIPPVDSLWIVGEVKYNPKPAAGGIIGYYNNRFGFGSSGPWLTSMFVSNSQFKYNGSNVYQAANSGTTGATAPVHTSGTVSDGTINWVYIGIKDNWVALTNFIQMPAIANIITTDAVDLASAMELANANKAKINEILVSWRTSGMLLP